MEFLQKLNEFVFSKYHILNLKVSHPLKEVRVDK